MTDSPRIAVVLGSDKEVSQLGGERISLFSKGATDVYRLAGLENCDIFQMAKSYFRQQRRHAFDRYDLIVNLITDADQNGVVLEILERALRSARVPVLNRPEKVRQTTRESVAATLAGIEGLLVPRVRKVRTPSVPVLRGLEKSGAMAFPAIVRLAGTHAGKVAGIVDRPEDAPAGARSAEGYYVTEFVDFKSADGLYRKFRLFVFGGVPVFRHLLISDRWNVHMADRERFMMDRPDLIEESQGHYATGAAGLGSQVTDVIGRIADRIGLDFFGVDFGILPDGRLVLFEANATMNFFPVSTDPRLAAMQACLPPATAAFERMLADALVNSERPALAGRGPAATAQR